MQVHLKALGCRLNEAELETWAREFRDRGISLTNEPGDADLVVVNSCAVTQEATRKSRKLLRRLQRDNPNVKIVLSGCYSSLNKTEAEGLPGIDLVVDNRQKHRLPEMVLERLDLPAPGVAAPEAGAQPNDNLLFARGRQRAFIKVQDGCRYRCTYCVVTLARGEERSRPIREVVDEINRLAGEGIREVVLAGVHLGGYGSDCGSDLRALVSGVLTDTDVPRIRLGSLEPWDIQPRFWSLFDNPRLMPHLHLPVQSGADSVLRRMARRCRSGDFARLVAQARERVAHFNVTTDIIVGFPGETEAEFGQTLELVRRTGFGHVHVFAYSPRAGTKAALMPDPVPEEIKRARSRTLREIAADGAVAAMERLVGHAQAVLIESVETGETGTRCWGYSPNYLRTAFDLSPGSTRPEGTIAPVALTGRHPDGYLLGAAEHTAAGTSGEFREESPHG